MADKGAYPVDPMAAFFAAVTAVENGAVGEIELEFRFSTPDNEVTMTMSVRREIKHYPLLSATVIEQTEDE